MLSVRLNEEDEKLVKKYAELHNISISELVRTAVLEHIEDEYDLKAYDKAMKEYKKNPVSYSHEEVVRLLEQD